MFVHGRVCPQETGGVMDENHSRSAYRINEICARNRVGRTKIYEEIGTGRLEARKLGRRTIVTAEAERRWLDSLPILNPGAE